MRNVINMLSWIGIFFTIIILILTILTTYQFVYIQYFNSYYSLQCSMFVTMLLWAMKMYDKKSIYKSLLNTIVCMLLAFLSVFFMFMNVH